MDQPLNLLGDRPVVETVALVPRIVPALLYDLPSIRGPLWVREAGTAIEAVNYETPGRVVGDVPEISTT